jgi:hypothetical protein
MEIGSDLRKEIKNCIMRDLRRAYTRKDRKYSDTEIIKKLVDKIGGNDLHIYREFPEVTSEKVIYRKSYRSLHEKLALDILNYMEKGTLSNKETQEKLDFKSLIEEKNYFDKLVNEAEQIVTKRKNRYFPEVSKDNKFNSPAL